MRVTPLYMDVIWGGTVSERSPEAFYKWLQMHRRMRRGTVVGTTLWLLIALRSKS